MTLLEKIHRGRRQNPPRLLIYGTEGIGKSTTAAGAPNPIFLPTEDGLDQIDCASFPLATQLSDVEEALRVLNHERHAYETVVIDSADWLERLVWDALCEQYGVSGIEKVDGGYARGYTHALTHWRRILASLDTLRSRLGMCVILLAHAKVEKFEDPESSAYDRYSPRLHRHVTALLTEWADAVLFATRKLVTKTEDAGFGRGRTVASGLGRDGGDRVLRTVGSPACVAKNRYGMPPEIPLEWRSLMDAISQSLSAIGAAPVADNPSAPPAGSGEPSAEPATPVAGQTPKNPSNKE